MTALLSVLSAIAAVAPGIPPQLAMTIAFAVVAHCPTGMRPTVMAIIAVESSFRPGVVSVSGDIGLMQVNSAVWPRFLASRLRDVDYNIMAGCSILKSLKVRYPRDAYFFTRFHSNRPSRRLAYARRLAFFINKLSKSDRPHEAASKGGRGFQ